MRCMIYERVGDVKRTIQIEGTLAEVTGLIEEFGIIDRPVEITIDSTLHVPLVNPVELPDPDPARGSECAIWPSCKCITRRQCPEHAHDAGA